MVVRKKGMKKKLSDTDMEDLIYSVMESSKYVKICCKAFNSHALHSNNINLYSTCMRSCMDLNEVAEIVLFMLSNNSPNTKHALTLAIHVVNTTQKECKQHKNKNYCEDTCKICIYAFAKYKTILTKLRAGL